MEQNSYIYNKVLNFRMWFKYGLGASALSGCVASFFGVLGASAHS